MQSPEVMRGENSISRDLPIALVVISDLEFGGAQRQVVELANHMQRYELHVCTLASYVPLAASLRIGTDRLHLVKRRWHYDFTVVPRLASLIRRLKADVVHGYLFDAEIASRLAGRLARVPVIGSERNANYSVSRSNMLAWRLTRRCVDLVIANSHVGADFNAGLFGLPRACYRVVHNGVNTTRFQPGHSAAVREELGFKPEHRVIGMFASFKKQKNHPLLLRVARRLRDRVPNLRLLFVGDELFGGGSDSVAWKREILQVVDQLGLGAVCVFAGNRSDVERLYPACDITVLPSLFEGTPNAALESMACGVPVVATDVSDNSYVIPDGQAGYVVPLTEEARLADAIEHLLGDTALRERFSRQARQWVVNEFSGPRLAEKTAGVYDEAVMLRSPSAAAGLRLRQA